MATDAQGTLVRDTAATGRGSSPARAPLNVIRVCELAAAMKQPNELVKPTRAMNQPNQCLKCRDRSRNGVASAKLPRKLTPVTGPFMSANPATAAQLDSTYRPVMMAIELNTVIGMYRLGSLDSSASAPEFSQPMKPETASAKVRPTRPCRPPGVPPEGWSGALRWCTCVSTTTDRMISPSASLQNMMNDARAEMTTPRSSSGRARATPPRVTSNQPTFPQPAREATQDPMNTTTAPTVTG